MAVTGGKNNKKQQKKDTGDDGFQQVPQESWMLILMSL